MPVRASWKPAPAQLAAEVHGEIIGGIGRRTLREQTCRARWNRLDPDHAGDFLDQIRLAGHLAPVAGHDPCAIRRFFQSDSAQCGIDLGIGQLHAQKRTNTLGSESDRMPWRDFTGDMEGFLGGASGELQDEFHRAGGGLLDALGIDAPLEAVAGITEEAERPRGAADTRRIEHRALEENLGG